LNQIVEDLNHASRHKRQLSDWASQRAKEAEAVLSNRLEASQAHLIEQMKAVRSNFELLGFDVSASKPGDLVTRWAEVSDLVERHLRDRRNLEWQPSEPPVGSVQVTEASDPVVDAARKLKNRLPELAAAIERVDDLKRRLAVGVDPLEVDEKYARAEEAVREAHPNAVRVANAFDARPELPVEVENRLRSFGLLESE
jgi:hypothetical protein